MKKYIILMVMGVLMTLMACGSGSTTTEETDTTNVVVDSTQSVGVDTTSVKQ